MRKSSGFTTLELMIVIAILVILVGLVVVGAHHIIGGGREKDTKVRLEALNGMLTEFEAVTGVGLKRQPADMFYDGSMGDDIDTPTRYAGPNPIDIWRDGDPQTTATTPSNVPIREPLWAPSFVSEPDFRAGKPGRFGSTAVLNTQRVMKMIVGIPAAQQMLDKLPANSQLTNPNKDGSLTMPASLTHLTYQNNDNKNALKPPLLVDAWNNPIIFVPASGLRGVKLKDHPPTELHVITSLGVFEESDIPPEFPPKAGARPFWASPGPDGDFRTHDDNVYSFQN
jgi:type II secretory pathway pseudopilin PulG